MNFYKRKNNKSNLLRYEIAKELNTNEEKIKELEEGKRNLTGETLEKYLEVTQKNEMETKIKNSEILKWYNTTDLVELRKEFKVGSQRDLSNKLNIPQPAICVLEKHRLSMVTPYMIKLYDFYHNDFNKELEEIKIEAGVEDKKTNNIRKELCEWYDNTDLLAFMKKYNISRRSICNEIKMPYSTMHNILRKEVVPTTQNLLKVKAWYDNYVTENIIKKDLTTETDFYQTLEPQDLFICGEKEDETEHILPPYDHAFKIPTLKVEDLPSHTCEIRDVRATETIDIKDVRIERYERVIDKLLQLIDMK